VASLSEGGQLGGWNCDVMPNVAGMRAEFVQTTGYELAMSSAHLFGSSTPTLRLPVIFSRVFCCYAFAFGRF